MRHVAVILIWVVLVSGMSLFVRERAAARGPVADLRRAPAAGVFSVDITTTFNIEPDPFAVRMDDAPSAALVLRFQQREVLRVTDRVAAGEPMRVDDVAGVVVGPNEFFLEATPPVSAGGSAHAVRVRVLRDGAVLDERTFWSEPGLPLASGFVLDVPEAGRVHRDEDDEHDH